MEASRIGEEANALIAQLAEGCNHPDGIGSFSPAIYDTAWVSMIAKSEPYGEQSRWRFPECFQYLLDHQQETGSWEAYATEIDSILNTLAGLLALKVHADAPHFLGFPLPSDIHVRISNAVCALTKMLQDWDVDNTVHVGFEILVPALLRLLEQKGSTFTLSGRQSLMTRYKKKLAKFHPDILYGKSRLTLFHSLEAFIGLIDFDRLSHGTVHGSMMGSPSSTAAYLMHSSTWDAEAEMYLNKVVSAAQRNHVGGIPSAYPAPTFMTAWATSTLLSAGFTDSELGSSSLQRIADYLEEQLSINQGLVGFAPEILEDADDTARAIWSLHLLGRQQSSNPMITTFENTKHFKTYSMESNPSFSANCNILIALAHSSDPKKHTAAILKAAQFLCDAWYDGEARDKWNLSPLYSEMLLSYALVQLLHLYDQDQLGDTFDHLMNVQVPLILCQIVTRVLSSFESPPPATEAVSYGILALTNLASIPWLNLLGPKIAAALEQGKSVVLQALKTDAEADYLWIEKVTFRSPILGKTYRLAALKAMPSTHKWGSKVTDIIELSTKALSGFTKFFSKLPLFSLEPEWRLQASLIEGQLFYPQLKRDSLKVFPRKDMAKDEYLQYIPSTWTTVNNCRGAPLSPKMMWEMMVLSMLNYQADEYMEAVVGERFQLNLRPISGLIDDTCRDQLAGQNTKSQTNGTNGSQPLAKKRSYGETGGSMDVSATKKQRTNGNPATDSSINDIAKTLTSFINHQMTHPLVKHSSPSDQKALISELQLFLHAHLTQIEDNARFASQPSRPSNTSSSITPYTSPKTSYFSWVHTTSATHTSCPYSFAYLSCLLGGAANINRAAASGNPTTTTTDCFPGAKQKYYAQALCRHLATMCRQYNDYGSVARDRAEGNLNSVNFPEFHPSTEEGGSSAVDLAAAAADSGGKGDDEIKAAVLELAEFERKGVVLAKERLNGELERDKMGAVREAVGVFVDVTDLYGQIYVARDIASRMK
ncbi:MAG: hypothetical protein Q9216_001962 [Gyalolechia sp. 2 TL-2023]